MSAPAPIGLSVSLQGYPCTALFRAERTLGLEPDTAIVHVPISVFKKFTVTSPKVPWDQVTFADSDEVPDQKAGGFLTYGELRFDEVDETGSDVEPVVLRHMCLTERAVESVVAFDSPTDVVRLELSDIRYLWATRGTVYQAINVPYYGTELGTATGKGTTTAKGGSLAGVDFVTGTLDAGDKSWTLRRVLEKIVLPEIPGAPILYRLPPDLENATPKAHIWTPALPKDALRDLLKEFNLDLALNQDASVSFWHKGEGDLTHGAGFKIQLGDKKTARDKRIAEIRNVVTNNHVPSCVQVVGPPIIEMRKETLEPVGEDENGQILPLFEALARLEVPAMSFALMSHERRAALHSVEPHALRAFEKWAFKWYRIPGLGTKVNTGDDRLPVLDRVTRDKDFRPLKPKVQATSLHVVDVAAALKYKKFRELNKLVDMRTVDAHVAYYNLELDDADGDYTIDRERGIVMFSEIRCNVVPSDSKNDTVGAPLSDKMIALGKARVVPATVTMEYGFTRKPAQGSGVSLDNRYHSAWIAPASASANARSEIHRSASGQRVNPAIAPKKVEKALRGALRIDRADLQEFAIRASETAVVTNADKLDGDAVLIAQAYLSQVPSISGQIVTLVRPMSVPNNGIVKSVVWSASSKEPVTTVAHLGAYAPQGPLPAAAMPEGRVVKRDSGSRESTYMTPGLKR